MNKYKSLIAKLLIVCLIVAGYFGSVFIVFEMETNRCRFEVNWERSGMLCIEGRYRAWWINYSYGRQFQSDGSLKNLWHFPKYSHFDMRGILKETAEIK